MHVCMLTDYFLPHLLGGTERAVYEIGRRMVKCGHQVSVLTLDVHGHERRIQIEGLNIYRLPAVSLTKFVGAQLTVSPFSLSEANRIIKSTQPDIVHAHNLYFSLTAAAPLLKRLRHVPLVTTLHLPRMFYDRVLLDVSISAYLKTVGHLIVQSSDKLIAVSRSVRTHAIEDLRVPFSKISFIPNGVDIGVYTPSNRRHENPTITYIGRLIGNKGPQYLIQAAPKILKAHPDVQIDVVGEGPLKGQLMRQVILEKLEDHIRFLGNVPDILPILQSTTIFVRPSLTEGMSLAILEAMACGLPVVASKVGGNAEIIDDGETGFLVPPADANALAETIEFLLSSGKVASEAGKNARRKTEKLYDWQKIADLTVETYSPLI